MAGEWLSISEPRGGMRTKLTLFNVNCMVASKDGIGIEVGHYLKARKWQSDAFRLNISWIWRKSKWKNH